MIKSMQFSYVLWKTVKCNNGCGLTNGYLMSAVSNRLFTQTLLVSKIFGGLESSV